jgi:hypothetical protein
VAGDADRPQGQSRCPRQPYKGEIFGYDQSSNWGYKNGQKANVTDNYKGLVTKLTYPLLVPRAHHYEPDQAGRHVQEPVQYP